LWQRATLEVVSVVVDTGIAALLGRAVGKHRALEALEARREVAERMLRLRWEPMDTARTAGASWSEIDTALGLREGVAKNEYESGLALRKQIRLAAGESHEPPPPQIQM
jgi:hypothetical protein